MNIIVYSEDDNIAHGLIAYADAVSDGVGISAVSTNREQSESLVAHGASKVFEAMLPSDAPADDIADTIAAKAGELLPSCVIVGSTRCGSAIAARIAQKHGTSAITDCSSFRIADDVVGTHMLLGGKLLQSLKSRTDVTVLTAGGGMADAVGTKGGSVSAVDYVAPQHPIKVVGYEEKTQAVTDLTRSKVIVCAGRGVDDKNKIEACRNLAKAIGGDVGCTRPVSEGDEPLMPTSSYIGMTGLTIKPDLYIGIGVSGQAQHTIGMLGSKVVVAINKDPKAAIHHAADYSIFGDLHEVVPALIRALAK